MNSAKRMRRQAATCAELAAVTHDEEGRERYLRLEQIYLQLAETEDPDDAETSSYHAESDGEPVRYRAN